MESGQEFTPFDCAIILGARKIVLFNSEVAIAWGFPAAKVYQKYVISCHISGLGWFYGISTTWLFHVKILVIFKLEVAFFCGGVFFFK